MAYPERNTGGSLNGFWPANNSDGTSSWMPIPPPAGSISFLTMLTVNRRKGYFVSGRLKNDVRSYSEVLGALSGAAIGNPSSRGEELSTLAAKPKPSVAPIPALAG
jgi:hypothetical protein